MMEKRVYINMNHCTGCRSCAAACAQGHHDQGLLKHGHVKETAVLPSLGGRRRTGAAPGAEQRDEV